MRWLEIHVKLHQWVVAFFKALSYRAIAHPRWVLCLASLVTLAAAPGIFWLKLRTDGHALVSPNAPEVVQDRAIREQFHIEDDMVVLIASTHTNGIFNPGALQLVRELTAELKKIPGVNPSNVLSLATEPGFRLRPGTLIHQTLLEPPMRTQAELDLLRDDLRQIELYTGTLVAKDGKSTVILIGAPAGEDRTRLYRQVRSIITAKKTALEQISLTGAPVAESLLGIHILEDLGVPKSLLQASTQSPKEQNEWKVPTSFYEFRLLVGRRIGLVPLAVLVMMLVFFFSFRNLLATFLPLPEVAATLLFVFGAMGWFGVPVYLTIAVMPVLLTAMCVTDEIHVFSRYFALLREKAGVDHVTLVRETVDEMVCPVANTTLTTAIGFVSFAFSPLRPVQAFGIFTALGVLFSLFYSLTVIPAMLTLVNPAWLVKHGKKRRRHHAGVLAAWFSAFAQSVVRWRYAVVALVVALLALAPFGLHRLVIQDSWIDGFAPESEFRQATALINEQYHGMHLLVVSLDAPKTITGQVTPLTLMPRAIVFPSNLVSEPALIEGSAITLNLTNRSDAGAHAIPFSLRSHIEMANKRPDGVVALLAPVKENMTNFYNEFARLGSARAEVRIQTFVQPGLIQTTADLASFLRQQPQYAVGGVLGPADYLATTRFMARPQDPGARLVPPDPGEIKTLWNYYGLALGRHRLRQIVDTNYWKTLTTVFLKNANFVDTAHLMARLDSWARANLAPKGVQMGFAGDVAVSQSLISGIVSTQLQSLFWSLVGIYAVTALLGRSLRWGIYCVLPSTLAVVINFAVMGWFGIPLGVATSMFAGMTLGIGVDFAIHLLEGYDLARSGGASPQLAMGRAMALTGPPVLINTLAVALGFGVLMLSQVPANARLGLLVVLGVVDCLIASLLLLPVLLHWWPHKCAQSTPAPIPTRR